jgi:lysophospholipase L1-like esterase
MPAIKPDIQRIVLKIAVANNDKIIYIKNLSKDGIHPSQAGYRQIVEDMK